MASGAAKWVWENSRASNGSLIVLLAVASEIDEHENCAMSVAEMARKTRLSERAVQNAVRDCERLGELKVWPKAGGHGRNGYELAVRRGADSAPLPPSRGADIAPPQNLHPAESAPQHQEKPQVKAKGAESAPQEIPDVLDLGSVVSGGRSKTKRVSDAPRPDVERVCDHLADRIEANGSNRPSVNQRWRTAARLLLDADKRAEDDVHKAIDWCQQNHFWLRNIRSMEKLREQYDRLRLDALEEMRKKARQSNNGHQPTTEDFRSLRDNWANPLDAKEAGIDPRGNGGPHRVHSDRLPAAED